MRQLEFIFSRLKEAKEQPVIDKITGSDHKLTGECSDALQLLGLTELANKVTVIWNERMRTTAGRAFWPCAKIELNPKLRDFSPEEVNGTMLHELAHLIAYARAGRRRIKAHGVEWQQACADLGIPGEKATHSLPLQGRTMRRRWRYTCPVCGEGFDRVHKMKRRAACYPCCKKHNAGYYHKDYKLIEKSLF